MDILFYMAVALTVLCVIRGWRRGSVMLIYGVAAWIFIGLFVLIAHHAIYAALMGSESIHGQVYDKARPYVNKYIPAATVSDAEIEEALANVTRVLPENTEVSDGMLANVDAGLLEKFGADIPEEYRSLVDDVIVNMADDADTVGDLVKDIRENAAAKAESLRESAVDAATETVTQYILRAASVVVAYVFAKIICLVVKIVLTVVTEREPIRTAVRVSGAGLGLLESMLYIWVGLYLIRLTAVTDFGAALSAQVEGNPYLYALDQNNLLAGFLGRLFGI